MTRIYDDVDYLNALKQHERIVLFYASMVALYLLVSVACIVWYVALPYAAPMQKTVKIVIGIATAAFILFSFPYVGIKMQRSRCYCRLLTNVSVGIKGKGKAFYSHIDDWESKDGVDVNVLVFKTWNGKKQKWDERNVYVDAEKELPEFEENEEVAYITQGNLLVEYERTGIFSERK